MAKSPTKAAAPKPARKRVSPKAAAAVAAATPKMPTTSTRQKTGRKSTFTQEAADKICELIAQGIGMHRIAKLPGMPDARTIYRWMEAHESFRRDYARAKDDMAEMFAAQISEIPDQLREKNPRAVDKGLVEVAKLQVDARKWIVSRLLPKKYGDRVTQQHEGPDGGPVVVKLQAGDEKL